MATTKKYAGLPDIDDAGTELFQTPGLTDDGSTVQSGTIRTESPTPSEDANDNFDRTGFNRDLARRRFEPAIVDARGADFSYTIGGKQKSYVSGHRRRRRVRRSNDLEQYGDISDEDDYDREESLSQKLARLKREAEEIRLELERRENEDEGGEFKESYEHLQGDAENEDSDADLSHDVDSLNRILNGLQSTLGPGKGSVEQEFSRRLQAESLDQKRPPPATRQNLTDASSSSINAISIFSDRLSALETALGLPSISAASNSAGILPTLDTLTNQINLLHTTITPKPSLSTNSTNNSTTTTPQIPHLDILQIRLHTLHQSATSLLNTRKQAQTALSDLESVRLRSIRQVDSLSRHANLATRRYNRPQSTVLNDLDDDTNDPFITTAGATSRSGIGHRSTTTDEACERLEIADEILTPLFLEEQAEKIKALYNVLPTIQDLQPLLPVVLDRLRALSVVHAGAAEARADMDEVEARLKAWEAELRKWKEAVGGVEKGIEEMKGIMKENVDVIGGMVGRVEERVSILDRLEKK